MIYILFDNPITIFPFTDFFKMEQPKRPRKRGGKREKERQRKREEKMNQPVTCVKVPGNLTCAAHSIFLSLFATGYLNPGWFKSISDIISLFVRKNYNIDGTESGCQIRTHMLRDLVVETVKLRGEQNFADTFGDTWYWGPEVESDIIGEIENTKENPELRGFIEYANPFFMVCSYLFKCKIMVIMDNGSFQIFSVKNMTGMNPIIKVRSNADHGSGTHFDALIPQNMDPEWYLDLSTFYDSGPKYMFEGKEYSDVILKIDDWYSYLGNRYLAIIKRFKQDDNLAKRLAELALQIEEDAALARELSKELNGQI